MDKDIQDIAFLMNDYNTIKGNYHFLNSEAFELVRIETSIKGILDRYEDNIPGLIKIVNKFPAVMDFLSVDKLKEVKAAIEKSQVQTGNQFYSYDGQAFSSIEEAMARNDEIAKEMQIDTSNRAL